MNALHPIQPADPAVRHLTGRQIAELIVELRAEGREFGLLWPSAQPGETVLNGRVLVSLGNVPASTLINLLALLREYRRHRSRP
ncbi:hypothetical protein F7Q99_15320 [Streptomyces kaniharaensis]|uniref:Uncharacterized protein n=1 Tax=Streptomyces kaniharaensis TaxID=212423 RepID=A0A6N7KPV5_9ACTN|nr:hypothetical protein [Streptomyces kaniharaensis]MQS13602.1 hypothetical protein [Streptomyces kaniharaensis]